MNKYYVAGYNVTDDPSQTKGFTMKTKKAGKFYAEGKCLVILTKKERDEVAWLLKGMGYKKLAKKVRQAKRI